MNLLHVYPQEQWHDDAFIVGNRLGLEALRDAISEALLGKGRAKTDAYVTDGEGYEIKILCEDLEWKEDFWNNLSFPYTDEPAKDARPNREVPWDIWGREETFIARF